MEEETLPYFETATIAPALASNFSVPASGGSSAVKTAPQALQRPFSSS